MGGKLWPEGGPKKKKAKDLLAGFTCWGRGKTDSKNATEKTFIYKRTSLNRARRKLHQILKGKGCARKPEVLVHLGIGGKEEGTSVTAKEGRPTERGFKRDEACIGSDIPF